MKQTVQFFLEGESQILSQIKLKARNQKKKKKLHCPYKNVLGNHSGLVVLVPVYSSKHILLICVVTKVQPTLNALKILLKYLKQCYGRRYLKQ